MEKFGPLLARESQRESATSVRRRLRVSIYDEKGAAVRQLTVVEDSGAEAKLRVPFSGVRGELVFEQSAQEGMWEEYRRESVTVKRFSLEHFRKLGQKVVRDTRTFVVRLFWFVMRRLFGGFPRLARLARLVFTRAWHGFDSRSLEVGPRAAWKEVETLVRRCNLWLYAYVGEERLGGLYQYGKSRPVVFDRLPELDAEGRELPKLTVVTPSYNQGHFLGRTMDSVLETSARVDYIVMDGGSKDDSVEVIRAREAKLKHWQSKPDKGQAAAIREGFSHTDCGPDDLMAYLNSDDLFTPGAVDFVVKWFALHPEVDVVYGHRIIINEKDEEVGRWVLPPHDPEVLGLVDFVPQETLFWRKRIYDAVGGIDPSFQFAMDWDFLLRLRNAGARIERLPWFLGCFRVHEAQKTQASINDVGAREIEQLRRRENGGAAPAPEVLQEAVMRSQVESYWYAEKIAAGVRL